MELLEERETRGFEGVRLAPDLERRISFLPEADRRLLEATLSGKVSRREAALIAGVSQGTMSRRIRAVLRRLADPLVVALMRDGKLLPELHQEVGLAYFLQKKPVRAIGREWGLSVYAVRGMLTYVRAWFAVGRSG